jgi:predicted  nucleic acid-binding Zn-ribbon protein
METSFDKLEERVRKAADLVRTLRAENKELEAAATEARERLTALEKERKSAAADSGKSAAMAKELKSLRQEREQIKKKIARVVEVLDDLDK